jgi:hypothetical protein
MSPYLKGMAREESEREDLLREATALVERIELAPIGVDDGDQVVAGFRREGGLSIYFGSDSAFHFNSRGDLRRAFANGLLIKAEHGQLVSLDRRRQAGEVQLIRHTLSDIEQSQFLSDIERRLADVVRRCDASQWITVGQVPADSDVLGRLRDWLARHPGVTVARSPNAR